MRSKKCEACNRPIVFLRTRRGGSMPVDAGSVDQSRGDDQVYDKREGHVSHFETCTDPDRFSHGRRRVATRG